MNLTRPALARPLAVGLSILLALAVSPVLAARAAGRATKVTITKFAVAGSKITLDGSVSLSASAEREHRRPVLLITVSDSRRKAERFTAKISTRDRFAVVHATRLTGALRLTVTITISGRATGRSATKTFDIGSSGTTGGASAPGGTTTNPSGSGTPSSPSSPSAPTETPSGPVALEGTFDIAGAAEVKGAVKGSWFEMLDPGERTPLQNNNSPLADKDFTPLTPGTSGGLQTTAFQPAPSPAFDGSGNALGAEIMQPQNFFGDNFSVVTEQTDAQTGTTDPLPHVIDDAGRLSGQVTAWAVGWNNQWFNQGSPKPAGTPEGETSAVTGSYDASTGQYELEWKSEIKGKTFNGFLGSWHLEGKFVPAS